jgi:ribonuclease P protein component
VRLSGRTYAHPLVVIICADGHTDNCRAGIITGKSIGNAVRRNQARRRLRAIISQYLPLMKKSEDLVIIGRTKISAANYLEIKLAVETLLIKAGLLDQDDCM